MRIGARTVPEDASAAGVAVCEATRARNGRRHAPRAGARGPRCAQRRAAATRARARAVQHVLLHQHRTQNSDSDSHWAVGTRHMTLLRPGTQRRTMP